MQSLELGFFNLFVFICLALSEKGDSLVENETVSVQVEYDRFIRCLEEKDKRCLLLSDQKSSGIYVYELHKNLDEELDQNLTDRSTHAIWSFDFMKSKQVKL